MAIFPSQRNSNPPRFVFQIPRIAFDPPPQVASALVSSADPGCECKIESAQIALPFLKFC